MLIEIKNRWNNRVIFSIEAENIKEALVEAIKSKANLFGAKLSEANLSEVDLSKANLSKANLSEVDLFGANLSEANLSEANLFGANLSEANLFGANLFRANLSGANLFRATGVNYFLSTPLAILLEQPQKIRAYKLVNPIYEGPYYGGIKYEVGKIYKCEANTDKNLQCSFGISLATLDWCMKEWQKGFHILIAEFTAKDIAAIPVATDGKFRVSKCKIVGEKDLKELGLVNDNQESKNA